MSKNLKNISLVSALTLVSRVLGLVRDSLTAAVFGTSALASAFITAYTLPNLFRRLLGEGALTAAFVPTLHDELSQRQREGAFRLISQVSSWLFLITSVIVALAIGGLLIVASSARQGAFSLAADAVDRWIQAAELAIWLFPYLIFVCLAAAYSAALQTLQRFLEPALSPIWLNYAIIACLSGAVVFDWGEGDLGRMHWLCIGVLIGGALQMIVPALTLVRMGWKPRFDLQLSPQVRAIARLMAPTVFGSAIYLINMAVSRLLGLSLDDASATLLNLAGRLMELPIGLFAVAVTTVIFPLISRYAATGDWAGMASSYRKGMRLILVLNIPAAAGLALLATPIVRLLFQHGEFTAQDTQAMMPVLAVYALGLPFFSFVSLTLRAFYAQKDTVTPVQAALVSFGLNLVLSFALMKPLGTLGLALAGNLAVVVQAIHLQRKLSAKRAEMAFAPLAKDLMKIIAATAVMAVVVLISLTMVTTILATTFLDDLLRIGGVITVGVGAYGATLYFLKIEGYQDLIRLLARKAPRTSA